jgi:PKD repeat protein
LTHHFSAPRRAVTLTLTLGLAMASLLGAFGVVAADASTPPVVTRDASTGVTADALPTAQINPTGWVEDQAIAGDTVYAGGSFTSARPAGSASGTNESARHNLLAFSLSTGNLNGSFAPNVNGEVRVLALSPDKSRLYVGGDFTQVDGVARNHLVAFSTSTGKVDPSFAVNVNGPVYAISATAGTVYTGGQFTAANGSNRGRLAAFRASDGGLLSAWTPKTDGSAVKALLVAPGGRVVAGGSFATLSNLASGSATVAAPGSASLDPSTGAVGTWQVNKVVKQYGAQAAVLSLHTDGTTVFGAGYWYGLTDANYEGVWAVSPTDGAIKWLADCHGDTYDTTVSSGVVYTASHHHDCSNIGAFPEQVPSRVEWRGTAFTADAQGDVQPNSLLPDKFRSFTGYKAPSVVNWFPQFANPTCATSDCSERLYANQPTITIESSGDYVVVGGQFPSVNGTAQQGLVRFAKASVAPKKDAPRLYPGNSVSTSYPGQTGPTVRAVASNLVRVTAAPWDRDNLVLSSVQLWRTDKSSPVYSASNVTAYWWRKTVAYLDRDVSPGQTYKYYVKMTDPDGNSTTTSQVSVTTPASGTISDSTYSKQVLADGASSYWRLDDPTGAKVATDYAGSRDLTLGAGVSPGAAGVVSGDTAVTTSGATNASASTGESYRAPQTYSSEAWFKTTSTTGGEVVGYGNQATGKSYFHDRQVYLTPSGQLTYVVNPGSVKSISSPKAYNDGKWHQVVATLSSGSGMVLYVDGAKVASWSSVTSAQDYSGFWRIAGDQVAGSGSAWLNGAVDDVSVYPTALSAAQVVDHYRDATGTAPASVPTAAFTTACQGLSCAYDASSSTPQVQVQEAGTPTIKTYAWSFGDGAKASGAKSKHVYKKASSYDVALTVTNSDGVNAIAVQSIEAAGNAQPVASYTSSVKKDKVTFDPKRSSDPDGKVAKYRWSFGDGSTSSKQKVSHTYDHSGIYSVRLTVADNKGATGSIVKTVQIGTALASDTFQRDGDAGWGSADRGGAWSTTPDDAFAVDGNHGQLTLADAGDNATATLASFSGKKANVVGDVTLDKVGTSGGTATAFLLRERSTGTYRAQLVLHSGGKLYLVVTRVVDGQEKTVKSVKVKTTYKPGQTLRVRASISSATKARIKMTVWSSGTKEPKAQLSTTDSTKALNRSGAVGVWAQAPASADAPVSLDYDNLLVTSS